ITCGGLKKCRCRGRSANSTARVRAGGSISLSVVKFLDLVVTPKTGNHFSPAMPCTERKNQPCTHTRKPEKYGDASRVSHDFLGSAVDLGCQPTG
ncbi:hypothetical protein, partial [Deinococcus xinjiangensis]|uniref:hypothetical protein n=1 Tax=Deinococcus xinjiangensis TaxID=457454 RepID=UPI0033658C21